MVPPSHSLASLAIQKTCISVEGAKSVDGIQISQNPLRATSVKKLFSCTPKSLNDIVFGIMIFATPLAFLTLRVKAESENSKPEEFIPILTLWALFAIDLFLLLALGQKKNPTLEAEEIV